MSEVEQRFHEEWLGLVQPVEGLLVSVPVLVEAQCFVRNPPELQQRLRELSPPLDVRAAEGPRRIADLQSFLAKLLDLGPEHFDAGEALPDDLALYVAEGGQTLRPTMALRRLRPPLDEAPPDGDLGPAALAGRAYRMLVWELPDGLPLDAPEDVTGPWDYLPSAKFDRLLRHCRVPIGLLTNGRALRLVYAPHGESTGAITFRLEDMATVGGRPILDAFVMLLAAPQWFAVAPERQLPALLARSREHQAEVTNELAEQVLEALEILLRGFDRAAHRDDSPLFDEALRREDDHVYGGLLTVLLRLVFLLYAEDGGLMPVGDRFYSQHLSVLGLFERLRSDAGSFPDAMSHRFGAWPRLLALFRAVYFGAEHGDFVMVPRRGRLFDPERFPFLEGWGPGGSPPVKLAEQRAAVRVPSVDDYTVYQVLRRLLVYEGQRLSYRALDVEQIGSVYEALMGYHVDRFGTPAVCVRPKRVWVALGEVMEVPGNRRAKWIKARAGLSTADSSKLAAELDAAAGEAEQLAALASFRVRGSEQAPPGRLVLQPGAERRRTSSHYTPRSLSGPIVRRTLEPLLAAMGPKSPSDLLLQLKVCDPAMGSGAFLVEACRFLADRLVAAWTRERRLEEIAAAHDDVVHHARRLIAQRCLYGVDRNAFAVDLAKLSLWLVTLAENEPFTFLDHSLRHGDSLVGFGFSEIKAFHWQGHDQMEFAGREIDSALREAVELRQQILALAADTSAVASREKERLLWDAEDALHRVRLLGDLLVGAYFSATTKTERERERNRRLVLVHQWLESGRQPPEDLLDLQREIRQRVPVFHWMLEFPEVFYQERPDPLDGGRVNRVAFFDAFLGNPPFAGKNGILDAGGKEYLLWLQGIHPGSHGNADLSAHFFRRADTLLGKHGTIGLIATNTIAQGDTRSTGLQRLVTKGGYTIYEAARSFLWPGQAAVAVSIVHLAKGSPAALKLQPRLDGERVEAVNSRLRPKPERPDPKPLVANRGLAFVGSYVLGMGFVLTPEERDELVARDPRNAERIFKYVVGADINSSPTQDSDRYVISFGQMSFEEAERWPDLLAVVREKVKPERDQLKNNPDGRRRKKFWWQFGRWTPALYEVLDRLDRCVVTSIVSSHLMFAFQPTDRIFAHRLEVFALEAYSALAALQSRVHVTWAWLLSSTMKNDINYTASDCFETFPFPEADPRSMIHRVEELGERLIRNRAAYLFAAGQGLTDLYSRLKDRDCDDPAILDLRRLHEELDRAVLEAYGWSDISVPAYTHPTNDAERRALQRFEDEVIDRLFALNLDRAKEEARLGRR